MKIVVIADVHGRTAWKEIVKAEDTGVVMYVFLGDYVSTHQLVTAEQQIQNLEEILKFKKEHPCQCVLLRGNHDCQHLFDEDCFGCCSYDRKVAEYMHEIKDRFLDATQWVFTYDDILFSHAGVSQVWMDRNNIQDVCLINDVEDHTIFGFTPDYEKNPFDQYGTSHTQPPTWIRVPELLDCMVDGYRQVIGHTTLKHIIELASFIQNSPTVSADQKIYDDKTVWCCDNRLESYLVYDDGVFTVKDTPKPETPT